MEITGLSEPQIQSKETALRFYRDLSGRMSLDPNDIRTLQQFFNEACLGQLNAEIAQIAIGVAFGDVLAKQAYLEWVHISDEYGQEIALCHKSAEIMIFPVSVIRKRIDVGNQADLSKLAAQLADTVEEKFASGEYKPR